MAENKTLPVTMCATTDLKDMLNPVPGRRQPMKGFDEEFIDIVDYIVRITYRIWDEKQVDLCKRYYSEDCAIETLGGDVTGVDTVIKNTWNTLKGWPDRTLDADNVVWSGNENDGYHSSHLITSHMTNTGPSEFGEPTGKMARIKTIADCLCLENRIIEEWLMRDNLGLVQQMGLNPWQVAKDQASHDAQTGNNLRDLHIARHGKTLERKLNIATHKPEQPESSPEEFVTSLFSNLWAVGDLDKVSNYYDYRVGFEGPGGRNLYGAKQIAGYIDELRTVMPDLAISIDHVGDVPYLGGARDIAVRWSLAGTHTEEGIYGEPSYGPVYILGGSHFRVINGRVRNESTVFDELAVMRQVERNRMIKS